MNLRLFSKYFGAAVAALFLCPVLGMSDSGKISRDEFMPIPNPGAYSSTF